LDPVLAILAGAMGTFVLLCLLLSARHPRTRRRTLGAASRDYEAEADIEAHDIAEMLEARNELRRRNGRPEIGDELAAGFHEQLNERRLQGP
jgi:predicted nucleic acid-binding protein